VLIQSTRSKGILNFMKWYAPEGGDG